VTHVLTVPCLYDSSPRGTFMINGTQDFPELSVRCLSEPFKAGDSAEPCGAYEIASILPDGSSIYRARGECPFGTLTASTGTLLRDSKCVAWFWKSGRP